MDTATAVTLVVLTSASSCSLSNIDYAEPKTSKFATQTECMDMAEHIDAKRNIRAFCLPTQENIHD